MRSNCMKRRVGAILVREKRIVATGYDDTNISLIKHLDDYVDIMVLRVD
jgi:deoxycytidylate deaminase